MDQPNHQRKEHPMIDLTMKARELRPEHLNHYATFTLPNGTTPRVSVLAYEMGTLYGQITVHVRGSGGLYLTVNGDADVVVENMPNMNWTIRSDGLWGEGFAVMLNGNDFLLLMDTAEEKDGPEYELWRDVLTNGWEPAAGLSSEDWTLAVEDHL